jgi:ubiquitin C-terminal hydrolase
MPKLLKNFLPEPFKSGFSQQDVSEFARFYIDNLERDLGLVNRKDLIKEIFVGKVRRTTVCQNNHYNITYEEYYDLMLNPLANGPSQAAAGKISGLVKNFSEPEGLDDYFCSICNAKFPAKLQNEIFS